MTKESVTVRPKFKLSKSEHKSLLRSARLMEISMSQYIRQAVMRRLDGAKYDVVDK